MPMPVVVLHTPSPLGLKPPRDGAVPGVRRMPEALRRAGLHDALGASVAGEVLPPPYVPDRDPASRVRNLEAIARYSGEVAGALDPLLDGPALPLVLGGDCSIFIGIALALGRRGRFGVVYVDAHSDCQTPESSETGGIAGMPLAIATGRGPARLTRLAGERPSVAESDAILLGVRDLFDVVSAPEPHVEHTRIRVHDLESVRRHGPEASAAAALDALVRAGVDGVWVHVDADVLDPEIMPAVDSPDPGGLNADELGALLRPLVASRALIGMNLTIYDPERDRDGTAAGVLVDVMARALTAH